MKAIFSTKIDDCAYCPFSEGTQYAIAIVLRTKLECMRK